MVNFLNKVVLCGLNARYVHTNLALRYLKAYTETHWPAAPEIVLQEWTINDQVLPIVRRLYQQHADLYAFSCYIWNIGMIRQISSQLKKVLPDAKIIWGGPEVSFNAAHQLQSDNSVDLIIRGEGEAVFLELLQTLVNARETALDSVAGLTWREHLNGRIVENPDARLLDASEWIFPYSAADLSGMKNRIIYYETSRGCPFRCSYCISALDRSVRHRPLQQIFAELDLLIAAGLRQVKLVDRTFNCQPERARQIWQYILDRRDIAGQTNFHFEIAADLLDDASVELLNQAPPGLFQLEIGVQSANADVLQKINRPARLDLLQKQVERLRQGNRIHLHLDLIAGLPGETLSQFGDSVDWIFALRPQQFQLGFLKVLPGSPMFRQAADLDFRWQNEPPYEILQSDAMSFADLIHLKNIEQILDFYYNSGNFTRSLFWLAKQWPRPYLMLADLARWAEKQGYLDRSLGIEEKSRLIWQFAAENLPALAEDAVLQSCWQDLIRFEYISIGQKDQPPWMNFWESSVDPAAKNRLLKIRQAFKARYPSCRRFRVDYFHFSLPALIDNNELVPADTILGFDLTGSVPALLDNQ